MILLNATPHAVDLIVDGQNFEIPPCGIVTRIAVVREMVDEIMFDGAQVPINVVKPGLTLNLPDYQEGVVLIVSRLVAEANPHRYDLVFPDGLSRNDAGEVIGCSALGSMWREPVVAG
jgi:hypothetical protein